LLFAEKGRNGLWRTRRRRKEREGEKEGSQQGRAQNWAREKEEAGVAFD